MFLESPGGEEAHGTFDHPGPDGASWRSVGSAGSVFRFIHEDLR